VAAHLHHGAVAPSQELEGDLKRVPEPFLGVEGGL
jgi:hypothetical protein